MRLAKPTVSWAIKKIEKIMTRDLSIASGPVFIIGSPRTGTTVLRQLISTAIDSSYFTNTTNKLFHIFHIPLPITSAILTNTIFRTKVNITENKSNYGGTPGRGAPCEGELIWGYWFGSQQEEVKFDNISEKQRLAMYTAVANTEKIYGKPFINKTTVLSLRIEALAKIFPKAVFIRIQRDPIDVAQSLLVARKTKYKDWLGSKPDECKNIKDADLVTEVCTQIKYTEEKISADEKTIGAGRFLPIDYKKLCNSPIDKIQLISNFLESHEIPVTLRKNHLPNKLNYSSGQRSDISYQEFESIRKYFTE